MNKRIRYIIGIDEAGRGPLAGPLSIGVVAIPAARISKYKNIRDSKHLSEAAREEWFRKLKEQKNNGEIGWAVSLCSNAVIDKKGIVYALERAISRSLDRLEIDPDECQVLLDGSLRAPAIYKRQETIIKGDEKVPAIALASILAKVHRDRKMVRLARLHSVYKFEIHKGYGTALHRKLIKKHGPSSIHRLSFLTRILAQG